MADEVYMDEESMGVLVLEAKLNELHTSVAHLKSSNAQLEEALHECPDDADFIQAITENTTIIMRKYAEIKVKQEALVKLTQKGATPVQATSNTSTTTAGGTTPTDLSGFL
eukprot:m.14955 g.14955  ORF g.14955 m.14955 type:complete len:111 (+) comp10357_c0_seq1:127-459(+)